MKPAHIKERRAKEVRANLKRQDEIYEKIKDLGYTELAKPIRHGWFKEIILTPKVERYKNQAHILEIYKKIEKKFWGRTKAECDKHWNSQISKNMIYRDLPTISKKTYNKLSIKAQKLCTSFQYREHKKIKTRFYIRLPKPAYKIRYRRAYITHFKNIAPKLESEIKYLNNQLLKREYFEKKRNYWNYYEDRYFNSIEVKKNRIRTKEALNKLKNSSIEKIKEKLWERN